LKNVLTSVDNYDIYDLFMDKFYIQKNSGDSARKIKKDNKDIEK